MISALAPMVRLSPATCSTSRKHRGLPADASFLSVAARCRWGLVLKMLRHHGGLLGTTRQMPRRPAEGQHGTIRQMPHLQGGELFGTIRLTLRLRGGGRLGTIRQMPRRPAEGQRSTIRQMHHL